jgi:hypothetical protein
MNIGARISYPWLGRQGGAVQLWHYILQFGLVFVTFFNHAITKNSQIITAFCQMWANIYKIYQFTIFIAHAKYGVISMYMEIVDELSAQGRFCFSFAEMVELLDASPAAIRSALNRLKKKGVLALPYQEFYVILPPEHRARGCLPPQQFIPDLMEYLWRGLLCRSTDCSRVSRCSALSDPGLSSSCGKGPAPH